jgi:site-specific DNA-methyltransferase (adenine-specific)
MARIVEASSDPGDVLWEPFGGLFTGALAAMTSARRALSCELDSTYFQYGVERLRREGQRLGLL